MIGGAVNEQSPVKLQSGAPVSMSSACTMPLYEKTPMLFSKAGERLALKCPSTLPEPLSKIQGCTSQKG